MCLLFFVPVSADTGDMVAWGNDGCGQTTAQPANDYVQVFAGGHNQALTGDVPEPINPTHAPKFPSIAVPLMLIVGLAGAIAFAISKQ